MRQVFILLLCALGTYATPNGATKNSCSSMLPEHRGVEVQNSRAPYTVSAVKSGNKVRISISSPVGEEIGGFMLQARTRDGSRLVEGKFSSSQNTKTIDCFQGHMNTLTHTTAEPKREIQTEWTPTGPINEDIIFRATVAKIYALYWDRIDSDRIKIQSDGGSSNTDRSSAGRMAESSVSMYEGCYVSKGCFAQPANCISQGDCEVLLSFSKISTGIRFSLAGYLEERMYMAMGLSADGRMGDDSVTECYREGSNVIARQSYNEGKSNSRTTSLPRDRYTGSYTNGLTTCTWTSPFVTQMFGRTYDLGNNTYYALLAKGPMENGRLGYHSSRTPSSERVNFTALEGVEDAGTTDSVKVHGESDETSLPNSPTVLSTDASTEAKSTLYTETHAKSVETDGLHDASDKPDSSKASLQLSFNYAFLFLVLEIIFIASGVFV